MVRAVARDAMPRGARNLVCFGSVMIGFWAGNQAVLSTNERFLARIAPNLASYPHPATGKDQFFNFVTFYTLDIYLCPLTIGAPAPPSAEEDERALDIYFLT
jgi:hypothetical protein